MVDRGPRCAGRGSGLRWTQHVVADRTNFVDKDERNRALGVFSAAAGGGGSLGIIAGGILTEWASWRWVLFVNVPIGIAILILAPRHVRESVRHPGRFDLTGALTSSIGVTALAYALIRGASDGWDDGWTLACFAAAVVLLAGFLLIERRASQPILPLGLASQRTRAGAYLNMFLLAVAMIGVFYFLTLFMQDSRGFTPLKTGLAFLAMTIPLFLAARLAPKLLAKLGAKPVTTIGTVLITASMAWLAQLDNTSTFTCGVLGPLLLVGAGVGLTFMPLNSLILSTVAPKTRAPPPGCSKPSNASAAPSGLPCSWPSPPPPTAAPTKPPAPTS